MFELFVSGFVLSLSLCLDLGIVNVAAFSTAATRGARPAFVLGLGSCFGDLVYATVAMLGVATLLRIEAVRWVFWIGGSAVLAYLAVKMLRTSLSGSAISTVSGREPGDNPAAGKDLEDSNRAVFAGDFGKGFAMAIASPSAILWFASVGGGLIATATGGTTSGVWLFFLGFFLAGVAWSAIVAVAGSRAIAAGAGFVRGLAAVSALLFALLALKLMIDGYHALIPS
jgi:L-lysine exporter family protein LysE/ArgO